MNLENLMFRLLAQAQEFFGPRNPNYNVTVEVADVPAARVIAMPDRYVIRLPRAYATDRLQVVWGIGHECGHVICGSRTPYVTALEEGACTISAIDAIGDQRDSIKAQYGEIPLGLPGLDSDYWYSEYLVFRLLDHDRDAIRKIREHQPRLSLADADLIRECVPSVGRRLADQLATKLTTTVQEFTNG